MRTTNVTAPAPAQQPQHEQQQQHQMVTNNPVGSLLAANLALQKMAPVAAAAQQQHAEPGHSGPSIGQQQPNLLLAAAAGIAAVQQQQQQQQKVGMANLGPLLPPSAVPSAAVNLLALQPPTAAANQMHGLQQPIGTFNKILQQHSPNQQQQSLATSSFHMGRAGTSSSAMPGGLRQMRAAGNAKSEFFTQKVAFSIVTIKTLLGGFVAIHFYFATPLAGVDFLFWRMPNYRIPSFPFTKPILSFISSF